jgi:ankyrin repeat protein
MRACRRGFVEIAEALIAHGADLEAKDQYGATALIIAASEYHIRILEALLNAGADINATDRNGWTALMWARSMGHPAAVKLLSERS